jgi:hypothetical protein
MTKRILGALALFTLAAVSLQTAP